MKNFLSIFFLLLPFSLFAQQNKIDSLENLLKKVKEDTIKVKWLNELSNKYKSIGEYAKSKNYAENALQLANQLKFQMGIADAHGNLGHVYYEQSDYANGMHYFSLAKKEYEVLKDKRKVAAMYTNIGLIELDRGNYPASLENHLSSLKIKEEIGDSFGIGSSYSNIGLVYDYQNDAAKALEYYIKSEKIYEKTKSKRGLNIIYNNIGTIYQDHGEYKQALDYFSKSLALKKELKDKKGIAYSFVNIGTIYTLSSQLEYDSVINIFPVYKNKPASAIKSFLLDSARNYFNKALQLKEELNDDYVAICTYKGIGDIFYQQKKWQETVRYFKLSIALADTLNFKHELLEGCKSLAIVYSDMGDYKNAYTTHQYYSQVKDSLFNEESSKQIHEMSTKYETEKKEKEIQLLNKDKKIAAAENKKQKIISYSVGAGLFLVLLLALSIFRANKKLAGKNSVIEKQNLEIAHKNKDLTDSILYAERIQRAILTSEQYLNDMFLPQGQTASHFILYKPKDIVAGDFYWAYSPLSFGEGLGARSSLAIWLTADCTGHGVPGAFMSMIGNSLLNEIVIEKGIHQPAEILNALRAGIIKAVGQSGSTGIKDGMDCALCCWDKTTNKLSFSGANNCLWVVHPSPTPLSLGEGQGVRFTEINPDKQPVGNYADLSSPFTQKEVELQRGDTLYTFTDGYADQFGGPKGKKFKYKPFKELLISIQHKSMPEQREILGKTINEWKGALEQIDDICIIGVRV